MTFSAAERRLTQSPEDRFLPRDWIALLAICLLAVAIRASVMALLPSILHPDEVMWLEQANRLVNHQGLVPWDFQLGERSWLWPGMIAGFMAARTAVRIAARGRPWRRLCPDLHRLAGAGDLRLPLGPQRRGLPRRGHNGHPERRLVRAGVFLHPSSVRELRHRGARGGSLPDLSRSRGSFRTANVRWRRDDGPHRGAAPAAYPCHCGGRRRRRRDPRAGALPGLARGPCANDRAERPARLDHLGLAVSFSRYLRLLCVQGRLRFWRQPLLLLHRLAMGFVGPLRRRDPALRALWRIEAAPAVLGGSDHLRGPFRRQSQGIPVYLAGPAAHHDARRGRLDDGGRLAGGQARPTVGSGAR